MLISRYSEHVKLIPQKDETQHVKVENYDAVASQVLTVLTHLLTFVSTDAASIEASDIARLAAELAQYSERHQSQSTLLAKLGVTALPFEYPGETFRQIASAAVNAGPSGRKHPAQQIVENLEVNGRKIPELVALLAKGAERLRLHRQSATDEVENTRSPAFIEREGLVVYINNSLSRSS